MYENDFKTFEILIKCYGDTLGKATKDILNKVTDKLWLNEYVSRDYGQFNVSLAYIRDSKVRKIEKCAVALYSPKDPKWCCGFILLEASMLQNDDNAKIRLNEAMKMEADAEESSGADISNFVVNLPEEDLEGKKALFVNVIKVLGFAEPMTTYLIIRFGGMEHYSLIMPEKQEPTFEFKAEFPFYEAYNKSSVVTILVYASFSKFTKKMVIPTEFFDKINRGVMKYIGHVVIDLKEVIRLTSENPRFINIYGNDPESSLNVNYDFTEIAHENAYVCTVLAQAQTHKKLPEFTTGNVSVTLDHLNTKFKIRFDALSIIGLDGDVRLELVCESKRRYSNWVLSKSKFRRVYWKEKRGRIPEFDITLIKDESQWPDIYINVQNYVHALQTYVNVSYIRLKWSDFVVSQTPKGIQTKVSRRIKKPMRPEDKEVDIIVYFKLDILSDYLIARDEYVQAIQSTYTCRFYLVRIDNIIEQELKTLTNPYIMIKFYGITKRYPYRPSTNNPLYCYVDDFSISLPLNIEIANLIYVYILDFPNSLGDTDKPKDEKVIYTFSFHPRECNRIELKRYNDCNINDRPLEHLIYKPITNVNNSINGYILFSCNLYYRESNVLKPNPPEQYMMFKQIRLVWHRYVDIKIYLIGIRAIDFTQYPSEKEGYYLRLQIDSLDPRVILVHNTKIVKERNNVNFMDIIEFKGVKVPLCYKLTQLLQVSLMTCQDEENNSRTSVVKKKQEVGRWSAEEETKAKIYKIPEFDKCFGLASIFLCGEGYRKQLQELFRYNFVSKEELSRDRENKPEAQTQDNMDYLPPAHQYDRGNWQTFNTINITSGEGEQEEDAENVKLVDKQLITVTFEEYLPAKDSDYDYTYFYFNDKRVGKLLYCLNVIETNGDINDPVLSVDDRDKIIANTENTQKFKDYVVNLPIEDQEKTDLLDEISVKQYHKTLKDDLTKSEIEAQNKEQKKKWHIQDVIDARLPVEWIKVFYKFKYLTKITARYMVIMAEDLKDSQGKGLPTTYLWIKTHRDCQNYKFTADKKVENDSPDYSKRLDVDMIFPLQSIVTVYVMSVGDMGDIILGETQIDLEYRMYHSKYFERYLVDKNMKRVGHKLHLLPVEVRNLYKEGDKSSKGAVKMFVEVVETIKKQIYPFKFKVNTNQKDEFELRVVIWEVDQIMLEWDEFHLRVKGYLYVEDLEEDLQQTDIHYNSSGWAEFNWRLVWRFFLPSKKTRLKFQIVSCPHFLNPFGAEETIREITYDLGNDMDELRREKKEIIYDRQWIKFNGNPEGEEGMLKFQMIFLPITIANSSRVGRARDEPNLSPVLKTPTEGRNLGWGFNFSFDFNLFGWVFVYVRYAVIILVIVGVLYILSQLLLVL